MRENPVAREYAQYAAIFQWFMWPVPFCLKFPHLTYKQTILLTVNKTSRLCNNNLLPLKSAVYQQKHRWIKAGVAEALVHDLRLAAGRKAEPSAEILDSRTLQAVARDMLLEVVKLPDARNYFVLLLRRTEQVSSRTL
jgi:hypothetical protein